MSSLSLAYRIRRDVISLQTLHSIEKYQFNFYHTCIALGVIFISGKRWGTELEAIVKYNEVGDYEVCTVPCKSSNVISCQLCMAICSRERDLPTVPAHLCQCPCVLDSGYVQLPTFLISNYSFFTL